jgi:hypothetical protein
MGITNYGVISVAAAMARARRLSRSEDCRASARKWNHVTLFGSDDEGDRAHYKFLNGKMTEKKVTLSEQN